MCPHSNPILRNPPSRAAGGGICQAGGTGSGLGARIIRELREAYPTQFIAAVAVAPFCSGENPLQSYNTVLCLATLQDAVDMVGL